jgi:hypothetical protein
MQQFLEIIGDLSRTNKHIEPSIPAKTLKKLTDVSSLRRPLSLQIRTILGNGLDAAGSSSSRSAATLPERLDLMVPVALPLGDFLDSLPLCHRRADDLETSQEPTPRDELELTDLPIANLRTLEELELLRSSLTDCTSVHHIARHRPTLATVCGVLHVAHALMIDWLTRELLTHGTMLWIDICHESRYYSKCKRIADIAPDPRLVFGAALEQPNEKFSCIGKNLHVLWDFFVHWEQLASSCRADKSAKKTASMLNQRYPQPASGNKNVRSHKVARDPQASSDDEDSDAEEHSHNFSDLDSDDE